MLVSFRLKSYVTAPGTAGSESVGMIVGGFGGVGRPDGA